MGTSQVRGPRKRVGPRSNHGANSHLGRSTAAVMLQMLTKLEPVGDVELSLRVTSLNLSKFDAASTPPGVPMATDLTGEFDPGSERTLAARLTHASRTRKGFGPGKVAHG